MTQGPHQAQQSSEWRNDTRGEPQMPDASTRPELFRGLLTKRFFAFLIDLVILSLPVILAVIFITIFGVLTLGLGWALFWLISPLSIVWVLLYYGLSLGGSHSATVGMRALGIEFRSWSGEPGYFVLGVAHAVLFWVSISVLSPFIVLVGLFNGRRRLLHDLILGTVMINRPVQSATLQSPRAA